MTITIINDCTDENAAGRQSVRTASLFTAPVSYIGVKNDIEAAGNIIDCLDAYGHAPGVILVNVAPRNGKAKKWENGTPFGYLRIRNVLVVATIDGAVLSLIKSLGLAESVSVLDIKEVVDELIVSGIATPEEREHIITTQFRSYDFLPRIARYLMDHGECVHTPLSLSDVEDIQNTVWWVDNFGNAKTTLIASDLRDNSLTLQDGTVLTHYEQLRDVPDGVSALVTGSSGLGTTRFLEVVVQGGSAAERHHLETGKQL